MNQNVVSAFTILTIIFLVFACGVLINIYIFEEPLGFAICGGAITLLTVGIWHLINDNKKK